MKKSLVLFDCDGVLVDSERIACSIVADAYRGLGLSIMTYDYYVKNFTGMSGKKSSDKIQEMLGHPFPQDFKDQLTEKVLAGFRTELTLIPNVTKALDVSPQRCVASGSRLVRVKEMLRITGIDHYFNSENLFTAEMVPEGKPSPDLFLYAAAEMKHTPEKCLVIEDSLSGVMAAKAAGMLCLGYVGGSHINDRIAHARMLIEAGASRVFESMEECALAVQAQVA